MDVLRTTFDHVLTIEGEEDDDAFLIASLLAGSRDAWAELYARYHRPIIGVAHRILANEGESEDVAQEVFLELSDKARFYDCARGSVRTWLLRLAVNRCLDRRRYFSVRNEYRRSGRRELVNEPAARRKPSFESSVDVERCFQALVDDLDDHQTTVVYLQCLLGADLRAIAQILDQPLANVRHIHYRALSRLRKVILRGSKRRARRSPARQGGQEISGRRKYSDLRRRASLTTTLRYEKPVLLEVNFDADGTPRRVPAS
jgi:RNA polymerase sigma-70 factor (ECF subfamily)